jgi:hypothetical protein
VAVNVERDQRAEVVPLLTAMRIGFVPVNSDWEWAEKQYGVNGTPATALIDQQGRIMFKPAVHDEESERVLAQEVEALLERR